MVWVIGYLVLSVLVSIFTILDWTEIENIELSTQVGDLEYHDFKYEYGLENLIFIPSILFCEVYKRFIKLINR